MRAQKGRRPRGHIRELPSGSFQVIVYAGTDPLTRKPRYIRETLKTYGAAEVALTRLQGQVDQNRHPKTDITLGQAISRWLEIAKLEDTTRDRYEDLVRMYVGRCSATLPPGSWTPNCLKACMHDCSAAVTFATAGVGGVMSADRSVAAPSERFITSSAPHWSRPSDGVTSA